MPIIGRNKVKIQGEITLRYEDERLTVTRGDYIVLDKCHADDCICILIGLGKYFPMNIIKQTLKISEIEEAKLPRYDDRLKSGDVELNEDNITSGTDGAGVVFVKYGDRILFEGSNNDAVQVLSAIGILIGNKTAYTLLKKPDDVTQIVFGL